MAGKPNKKVFATMIEKHGSEEAARAWFSSIGKAGGSVTGRGGGFADMTPCSCSEIQGEHSRAQCAGKLGGSVARRQRGKE